MRLCAGVAAAGALFACAEPYELHGRLTDPVFRERAASEFRQGMTALGVETRLDELRQDAGLRLWYEPTESRGRTLLARFFPPGGFWIRSEDQLVEWVDLAFEFTASPGVDESKLIALWMFRDKVRYFQGGPAYGPRRPAMARVRRWPGSPPPPVDPFEGAWPVWSDSVDAPPSAR
jgi:hypothetical protein